CKMYLRPLHLFYETGENPEGTNLHNEDMLRTNTGLGSKGIRATGRLFLTQAPFFIESSIRQGCHYGKCWSYSPHQMRLISLHLR
ncbi:MAG: hypothetical protein NT178_00240, partial [Proteobacteria bacterium]|nr:hypothetical protein [Pseudomonadota bacterium]